MYGRVAAYVPYDTPSVGAEVVEIRELLDNGTYAVENRYNNWVANPEDLTLLIDQHDMDEFAMCNLVVVAGNSSKDFVCDYGRFIDYDHKSHQTLVQLVFGGEQWIPTEWLARLQWSPWTK